MIPQVVKKIDSSEFRFLGGVFKVSTKKLAELNITENEPFQIIDEGGSWDGNFAIVQEFWVNDWQTIVIITYHQPFWQHYPRYNHPTNIAYAQEHKFKTYTSSPFSVAELASVTRTLTKSPTRCVPLSNTTTRFCSVRPNSWSRERLETPSTSTS